MYTLCEYKDNLMHFHHSVYTGKMEDLVRSANRLYQILFLVYGDAHCTISDDEYDLKPGCMIVLRDAEIPKISITGGEEYSMFSLCFSPTVTDSVDPQRFLLDPFVKRPLGKENVYYPSSFKCEQPLDLFTAMCNFLENKNESTQTEIMLSMVAHLLPLLVNIRLAFLQIQNVTSRVNIPTATASDLLLYINSHLYNEISLKSISQHFFLSVSQLERIFKNHVGMTIWEYVIDNRLDAAREKILSGVPAGKTASECGFGDYSSFYRSYLRKFGISPNKDNGKIALKGHEQSD